MAKKRAAAKTQPQPKAVTLRLNWTTLAGYCVALIALVAVTVGFRAWQSQRSSSTAVPTPGSPFASTRAGMDKSKWFVPTQAPPDRDGGDLAKYCEDLADNVFLGTNALYEAQHQLDQLYAQGLRPNDQLQGQQLLAIEVKAAHEYLKQGDYLTALDHFDVVEQLAIQYHATADPFSNLYAERGAVHLRMAEAANCATTSNPYVCLVLVGKDGRYQNTDDIADALVEFDLALKVNPRNMMARWLLNVAHMLLRDYPEGVPVEYLIPPAMLSTDHPAPRFRNIARDLGMATVNLAGGGLMEDLDGDGRLDILSTSLNPCGGAVYFHNEGNGKFANLSAASKLSHQTGGFNVQQTDYNNDGHLDLFITRGAWQFDSGRMRVSLMKNNGDGTFDDITHEAGLADLEAPTQASAWADFDLDGDLDVFIGREQNSAGQAFPCQLFRNNGDGTFTDIAKEAGVTNNWMTKGAAFGDMDNDGDPDLYVSNIGPNRLYRNNGDGTFTDIAETAGVVEPKGRSFATWFFDFDNDGWLDIWVGGYSAKVEDIASNYLGIDGPGERPKMYRNLGNGKFEDATARMGLNVVRLPMGANFGDIDNDGWLDFYLGTGDPLYYTLVPNEMYWNDRGQRFLNVTAPAGVGHLPKGHGVAFGDLDDDGDQDLFLEAGGFSLGDASPNALFLNPGSGNHWITLRLEGTHANRPAIGARIKLSVDDGGTARDIYAIVSSGGSFGSNSLQQEIGLGKATRVKSLDIEWPGSKVHQTFTDLAADKYVVIREGEDKVDVQERTPIQLGPPQTASGD